MSNFRFRYTVLHCLTTLVLIALNLAMLSRIFQNEIDAERITLELGILPSCNVLVIVIYRLLFNPSSRKPSAIGFILSCSLIVASFILSCLLWPDQIVIPLFEQAQSLSECIITFVTGTGTNSDTLGKSTLSQQRITVVLFSISWSFFVSLPIIFLSIFCGMMASMILRRKHRGK